VFVTMKVVSLQRPAGVNLIVGELGEISLQRTLELSASHYPEGHPVRRADYLKWLYLDNPHGRAKLVVTLAPNGSYSGVTALVPFRAVLGSETIGTRYILNVLVHPAHRGRKLALEMATTAVAEAHEHHEWAIAHPNEASYPVFLKTNMKFRAGAKLLVRPPGVGARVRGYHRVWQTGESASQITGYGFDLLAEWRRSIEHPVLLADEEFLRWRYMRHPVYSYRLYFRAEEMRVTDYFVARRFRTGVDLAADWQGSESWRLGPPSIPSAATLVPWPNGETLRPRFLFNPRLVKKEFRFFATAPPGRSDDTEPWSYLTLGASDIG
jgi:Acetyltransferase (GNAT) domain